MTDQTAPGPQLQLEERVRQAFEAVRRQDLDGVTKLQSAGGALVPLLEKYLRADQEEAVRREAVSLLGCVAGPAALPFLVAAVTDPSPEIRERAARGLYEKYTVPQLVAQADLAEQLLAMSELPDPPAAGVLLMSYFPSEAMSGALEHLRDAQGEQQLKLFEWSAPVELSLVAQVALARHGVLTDQRSLEQTIASATVAQAEFLLAGLREIDSSLLLRELAKLLTDVREVSGVVHSAPMLKPRVCDVAVNAFVHRLDLSVSFELDKYRQYDAQERDEVQQLIEKMVPSVPLSSPR